MRLVGCQEPTVKSKHVMWTFSHSFCLLKFTSQFSEPQRPLVSHKDWMQGRALMEAREEVRALSDDVRKKTMNNRQEKGNLGLQGTLGTILPYIAMDSFHSE